MPHTLAQINRRASAIREQADRHKQTIGRIRSDIVTLGLAPSDIFPEGWPVFAESSPAAPPVEIPATARYADGPDRTWTGKGRRPFWLLEALGRGAELDDFLIKSTKAQGPKGRPHEITNVAQPGIMYRSPSGEEWQGKGRRPRWLATALDAGARLDDFAVLKSAPGKRR